jgi:4-methylaminobutanoate oxidase (formaldehyde-forming)
MEKGYRHWGHDIGEEDTPYHAGLGFAVALDKPGGFIGRDALLRQRAQGPVARRLVQLKLATDGLPPHLYHNEPILRDGEIVGSVTSGAFGHRIGASLGMGYVTHPAGVTEAWLADGRWEVEIAWKRYPVTAQLRPWYDPKGDRLTG